MSTRGAIVRMTSEQTFKGAYHHWDGYPTGLGKTLFGIYNGHFKKDLKSMLDYLIDQHTAGWSTINDVDFTIKPGFGSKGGPVCYCHGDRHELGSVITEKNASGIGCEYVYAFTPESHHMMILSSYCENGDKMIGAFGMGDEKANWKQIAYIDLQSIEPDWTKIESV
jgi:hypothetical protein